MENIDYSKNWEMIFNISPEELLRLDFNQFDEEDLDAVAIRLKQLGQSEKVLPVYEAMLSTNKENPAVEYTNIFEEVIIHWMSEKNYAKAAAILEDYRLFDEKQRQGYRNHFIRRNLGICYIFSGKVEKGDKLIEDLIHEAPKDYWTYHDIALEYYFSNDMKKAVSYLQLGQETAHKAADDFWYHFFQERMELIVKG